MEKEELIISFRDTLEKSNSGNLKQRTEHSIASNRVYKGGFISTVKHRTENASVEVYSGTTFDVAKRYAPFGKTAVLNFANPENPGGGVQFGAMAQEECLCRSSNLFFCISNRNVFNEYYEYHRNLKNWFYTDRLIYTKDVTVFKDDSIVPQMLPETDFFDVDVITCAAPYIAKRKHTDGMELLVVFKSRVKNIFEAARDNQVDYLILGAFGCGAFKNPPFIVAEAFRQAIVEEGYLVDFKEIIFAIKPTGENCPNLNTFEQKFAAYAADATKRKVMTNTVEQPEKRYIGKTIAGKYEVFKWIGGSGLSPEYLARDIRDNKVWAIKAYDKQGHSHAIRENMLTLPYMMQKLNHPAVPKVIDIIENEDSIFIVKECIAGESLETVVKKYGAQPVEKVVEWSKQMCSALGYLHSQNPHLIYRNMTPYNIILMEDGTVKFIDFGFMCIYKPNQKSNIWCCTKGYSAPEQYIGSQSDARTDIFGLGMIMFRLVTGIDPSKPPYEVKPICSVNPNLPKGLEYIVLKCVQPNPAKRYQSCDELMIDLNNYLNLPKSKGIIGKLLGKK